MKVETAPIVLEDPVPTDILVAVGHVSAAGIVEEAVVFEVSSCDLPPTRTLECSTEGENLSIGSNFR